MNKKLAKIIVALVAINMWVTCVVIAQPLSKEKSADFLAVSTSTNSSIINSQNQSKFPEDNPTTRVYAKSRTVFKAYKGRGTMVIQNHGAKSAEIYVNGNKININKALKSANETQKIGRAHV